MNFLEVAKSRYTTMKYDNTKKLSEEQIENLKEIIRLSPSTINSQPWQFVFISDEEKKSELAAASFFNADRINEASHLVVFNVVDSLELFEKQVKENLSEGAYYYYENILKPKGEEQVKIWMKHQVYLSLGFFLAACASLGIDSTPMEGIDTAKYDEILGQKDYKAVFAVAIGYRNTEDANQPSVNPKSRLALEKVVVSK